MVAEVLSRLQHEHAQQVNLASILSATRYKTLTMGRVYHMECPKTYRYTMLECYNLREELLFGWEAAPFLSKMARATLIPTHQRRIPYFERYRTAGQEAAAPREAGGDRTLTE